MAAFYDHPVTDRGGTWATNRGNADRLQNINSRDQSESNLFVRYRTATSGVLNLDHTIPGDDPIFFNWIYLVGRNIGTYKIWASDRADFDTEVLSVTSGITTQRVIVGGNDLNNQYDLRGLTNPTATLKFRVQVLTRIDNTQPVEIFKVYPMTHRYDLDIESQTGFIEQTMDHEGRTSFIRNAIDGTRDRSPLLYGHVKRNVTYTWLTLGNDISDRFANLRNIFGAHPNFIFEQEFERYPERVFYAHFQNDRILNNYRSTFKGSGETFSFTIEER